MKPDLKTLIEALDAIGEKHEELRDTACRGALGNAIFDAYLIQNPEFKLPSEYGMETEEGNQSIKRALQTFLETAPTFETFSDRLGWFQDNEVISEKSQRGYDAFFGWHNPEDFDKDGNPTL